MRINKVNRKHYDQQLNRIKLKKSFNYRMRSTKKKNTVISYF